MNRLFFPSLVCLLLGSPLHAGVVGQVTNDVIFGSGNANEAWTIARSGGVELGLRAKVRFDENNQPQNTFNHDGNGVYTHLSGQPSPGFGFAPNSSSSAKWNFEWSINSDFDGTSNLNLDDLTYQLSIDFDPEVGTQFLSFDPINLSNADHGIGNNNTANGGGSVAADSTDYAGLIGSNNLAQNSWNMEFFDSPSFPFNANRNGLYTFELSAFDGSVEVAKTSILVSTVPEPSTLLSFAAIGLLPVAPWTRRRRRVR